MHIIKVWKQYVGKEMTLLDFDNHFSQGDNDSIFNYGNSDWLSWKISDPITDGSGVMSFTYIGDTKDTGDIGINIEYEVIEDKGLNEETIIKILDMYYL